MTNGDDTMKVKDAIERLTKLGEALEAQQQELLDPNLPPNKRVLLASGYAIAIAQFSELYARVMEIEVPE